MSQLGQIVLCRIFPIQAAAPESGRTRIRTSAEKRDSEGQLATTESAVEAESQPCCHGHPPTSPPDPLAMCWSKQFFARFIRCIRAPGLKSLALPPEVRDGGLVLLGAGGIAPVKWRQKRGVCGLYLGSVAWLEQGFFSVLIRVQGNPGSGLK